MNVGHVSIFFIVLQLIVFSVFLSHSRSYSNWICTKVDPLDWGFPGYLTPEEDAVLQKFSKELQNRGEDWQNTVFSFGRNECEEYALCRWLRARKFVLEDVLTMVDEATQMRIEPKRHDFYPDPKSALGVEEAIYKTQYPQLFYGNAKNGW